MRARLNVDLIHPIGSVYISFNSTHPAKLFGGTWEQIEDMFLLACGPKHEAGVISGSETHTLTVEEMPKTSFGLPHTAYYDSCLVSNGGYTETRKSTLYEGHADNISNAGWHILSTGGGQPHSIMPINIAVYMWTRIA